MSPRTCLLTVACLAAPSLGQGIHQEQAPETVTFELSARIVDPAGKPIEGACLATFKTGEAIDHNLCRQQPAVKSGADGKLKLTIRYPSNERRFWLLAAKKFCSLSLRVSGEKVEVDGVKILRADLGDVVMQTGTSILGLVRGDDKKPIVGAKVVASGILSKVLINRNNTRNTHTTICYGVSDAQGRVRLVGIPAHGVSVKVSAEGHYKWHVPYLNRHTPLVATLQKGGQIAGTVVDFEGKPVKGARIYVYSETSSRSTSHVTEEDGKFKLDLTSKGRFRIRYYAKLEGDRSYTYEYTKIMQEPKLDLVLQFGKGAIDNRGNPLAKIAGPKNAAAKKSAVQEALAKKKGKVTLRIIDAKTGIALREARATSLWWDPNMFRGNPGYLERQLLRVKAEKLDERGQMLIPGPSQGQPNTGRILVAAKGYAPMTIEDVEFQDDEPNEITVELLKESAVSGVVIDPDSGKPLAGVKVVMVTDPGSLRFYDPPPVRRKLDGNNITATTDEKGAFRLGELPDGEMQIYLAHPKRCDVPPMSITLKPGEDKKGLRVEYPKGGSLLGTITGTDFKAGWSVRIRRMQDQVNFSNVRYGLSQNERYESARVDSDGRFAFHGLSRANYLLSLVIPYPHGAFEVTMEPIRMRSRNVERAFDVSEDMPGRLTGKVVIEGANFAPGRLMLLATRTSLSNNSYPTGRPNLQGEFAFLSGNGKYQMQLAEGQYYLQVVDLQTKLTLLQTIRPVSIRSTLDTEQDLTVPVALVTLSLSPEKAGDEIRITRIEIRPEHPKPPSNPRFGFMMGQQDRDTGVGMPVEAGQTEIRLILPRVPCKLLARSDAHNLDPKVHQYNFPAQGEIELTPTKGKSNKVEIDVTPPAIEFGESEKQPTVKTAVEKKAGR